MINLTVYTAVTCTYGSRKPTRSLTNTARRDYMEFFIEDILSYVGNKSKPSTMRFHVKWLNYDSTPNMLESWQSVRLITRCHLLAFVAKVEKQLQATVSIQ